MRTRPHAWRVRAFRACPRRARLRRARPRQVVTAITVLLSSRSDERDNRRGGGGMRVGGGFGFHPGLFDFYFWDPYYMQRRRAMRMSDPYYEMGFLEVRCGGFGSHALA